MLEKLTKACDLLHRVPHDVYAVFIMLLGGVLVLCGCKDEGKLAIVGGLSVFKGQQ